MKADFNNTQAEQKLLREMKAAYSSQDVSKTLKDVADAGVMVPSVRDADGTGYDIFSLLLKERIIMVNGEVEGGMAAVVIAQLRFLNGLDPSAPISMWINSPGGSVVDGQAIYDVMRSVDAHIKTIGVGMQASMGSVLLAGGDERMMAKGSQLMIHSIASRTEGELVGQEISLEKTRRLFDDMKAVYVRHVGLTPEFWDLCCAKNTWFSAKQALKMGFIDEIYSGANKQAKYEKSAEAFLQAAQDKRDAEVPKTVEGIKELLLGTSRDEGKGERLRAECLVALSQKPQFWTAEKKLEMKAKTANDNDDTSGRSALRKVIRSAEKISGLK